MCVFEEEQSVRDVTGKALTGNASGRGHLPIHTSPGVSHLERDLGLVIIGVDHHDPIHHAVRVLRG